MDTRPVQTALLLSRFAALLAILQAGFGLFYPGIYRDMPLIVTAMKGNDAATLFVVAPLFSWSIASTRRGSAPGLLLWLGCLGYLTYNYIYYLYGIAFNRFFLIYAAVFICALYAFVFGLAAALKLEPVPYTSASAPVRWPAGFLAFIGGMLAVVEGGQIIGFLVTGDLPQAIAQFGDPDAPATIFAADLTIVVPAFLLAAVWLLQRQKRGFLLAAVMLVKAFTYGVALLGMVGFQYVSIGKLDGLWPFYAFVAIGGLFFLIRFLRSLGDPDSP